MEYRILPPPAGLQQDVHHALLMRIPAPHYKVPAQGTPTLCCILQGQVVDLTASPQPMPAMALIGPARHYRVGMAAPGTLMLSLTFRPGRLAHVFDLSCEQLGSDTRAVADCVPPALYADWSASLQRADDDASRGAALFEGLLRLKQQRPSREEPAVPVTLWDVVQPQASVAELAGRCGLGERQFERRFRAAIGMSLREYRQLYRYMRTVEALCLRGMPQARQSDFAQTWATSARHIFTATCSA